MRLLPNGSVYLEKGEPVPVWCDCGHVYQPSLGSFASTCAKCGAQIIHDEQEAVPVRRWRRREGV